MSQGKNVIDTVIDLWNTGNRDFSVIAQFCDPTIELESPFSSVVGEPYRGHAGIKQWIRDVDEQFSDWRIDHDDVREIGDRVIAIGTIQGRGRASGVGVEFPFAMVAHFGSDHRITRIRIYRDVSETLETMGISE